MYTEIIGTILQTIGILIGFVSLAWGIIWGVKKFYKDNQIATFSKYSEKYNNIVSPKIYGDWYKALKGDENLQKKLEPIMIAYLNLVWEECFLHDSELVSDKLWQHWEKEIKETIKTDFAKEVMKAYEYHFPESLLN